MPQIEIKITPNGKIEAETHGVKGKKCMDYLKMIEQLTNAKVYDSDYTEDFYMQEELADNINLTISEGN